MRGRIARLLNLLQRYRRLQRQRRTVFWLGESLALAAALAVLGVLLRPHDPLFDQVNPAPYLILPVLMGAQYGVAAGIAGAASAVLARCGVALWMMGPAGGLTAVAAPYDLLAALAAAGPALDRALVIALFASGVVIGELRETLEQELVRAQQAARALCVQLDGLAREHLLLKETKSSLEQRLAEVADSQSTIFDEATDLHAMDRRGVDHGILRLLQKYASVERASLYRWEQGALRLAAQLGSDAYQEPALDLERAPIARAALQSLQTVTVRDLGDGEAAGRGLIAAPLAVRAPRDGDQAAGKADRRDADGDQTAGGPADVIGVIVVDAIPFIRLNEATVRLITLIADWGAQVIHESAEQEALARRGLIDPILQVYRAPYMRERLQDEVRRARRFNLDLQLLAVAPAITEATSVYRDGLGLLMVAAARESCRPGDVLGVAGDDTPHAVVLMPMTRRADAERRLEFIRSLWAGRVREHLQGEELPALETLLLSSREMASSGGDGGSRGADGAAGGSGEGAGARGKAGDAGATWRRIEHWVAQHG